MRNSTAKDEKVLAEFLIPLSDLTDHGRNYLVSLGKVKYTFHLLNGAKLQLF